MTHTLKPRITWHQVPQQSPAAAQDAVVMLGSFRFEVEVRPGRKGKRRTGLAVMANGQRIAAGPDMRSCKSRVETWAGKTADKLAREIRV